MLSDELERIKSDTNTMIGMVQAISSGRELLSDKAVLRDAIRHYGVMLQFIERLHGTLEREHHYLAIQAEISNTRVGA